MYVLCAVEWSFRAISYRFVHRRTSRFGSRFGSKRDFKNMVELFGCKMQEKAPKSTDFGAFYGGQYRTRTRLAGFESCSFVFCRSFLCSHSRLLCRLLPCRFWLCLCRKAKNKAKIMRWWEIKYHGYKRGGKIVTVSMKICHSRLSICQE